MLKKLLVVGSVCLLDVEGSTKESTTDAVNSAIGGSGAVRPASKRESARLVKSLSKLQATVTEVDSVLELQRTAKLNELIALGANMKAVAAQVLDSVLSLEDAVEALINLQIEVIEAEGIMEERDVAGLADSILAGDLTFVELEDELREKVEKKLLDVREYVVEPADEILFVSPIVQYIQQSFSVRERSNLRSSSPRGQAQTDQAQDEPDLSKFEPEHVVQALWKINEMGAPKVVKGSYVYPSTPIHNFAVRRLAEHVISTKEGAFPHQPYTREVCIATLNSPRKVKAAILQQLIAKEDEALKANGVTEVNGQPEVNGHARLTGKYSKKVREFVRMYCAKSDALDYATAFNYGKLAISKKDLEVIVQDQRIKHQLGSLMVFLEARLEVMNWTAESDEVVNKAIADKFISGAVFALGMYNPELMQPGALTHHLIKVLLSMQLSGTPPGAIFTPKPDRFHTDVLNVNRNLLKEVKDVDGFDPLTVDLKVSLAVSFWKSVTAAKTAILACPWTETKWYYAFIGTGDVDPEFGKMVRSDHIRVACDELAEEDHKLKPAQFYSFVNRNRTPVRSD